MYLIQAGVLTPEQADQRYQGRVSFLQGKTELLKDHGAASACATLQTEGGARVTLFILLREDLNREALASFLYSAPGPRHVLSADLLSNETYIEIEGAPKCLYVRADSANVLWSERSGSPHFDIVYICGSTVAVVTHHVTEELARRKRMVLAACESCSGKNHHPEQLWSKEILPSVASETSDLDFGVFPVPIALEAHEFAKRAKEVGSLN